MLNTETYSESKLSEMIHAAGIRPSVQRIAILAYIANERKHPTVDEIYTALLPSYPSMSRTTVYNSVHVLVDAQLVRELDIDSGNMHYDLAPQPHHSHFMCRHCGCIYDMSLPAGLAETVESDFSVDTVDLYFKGLCPKCKENN